jgi:hypothetical protein
LRDKVVDFVRVWSDKTEIVFWHLTPDARVARTAAAALLRNPAPPCARAEGEFQNIAS